MTKGAVINGPRPMPVRMNKESHLIHKPATDAVKSHNQSAAAKREPVIIYTQSPRVINATIDQFMALVQKLTGVSCDESEGEKVAAVATTESDSAVVDEESLSDEKDGNGNESTTSVVTDDDQSLMMQDSTAVSPMYNMSNAFMLEAPLFTQNSNELFCSPPSFMDYMKAFPDC